MAGGGGGVVVVVVVVVLVVVLEAKYLFRYWWACNVRKTSKVEIQFPVGKSSRAEGFFIMIIIMMASAV